MLGWIVRLGPDCTASMPQADAEKLPIYNTLQNLGFFIVVFYVFGVFSAWTDKVVFLHKFRLILLAALVGLAIVGLTGRITTLIKHQVGMSLLVFTVWLIICIPFSIWPGGAFNTFINDWQKAALTFYLVGGLMLDYVHGRKIIHALGYAAILLSLFALQGNAYVVGRLVMPNTRFSNPNDLAMILLTAVPALGFMAVRPSNGFRRLIALGGSLPVLLAIAKTGSRAAVIGGGIMLLIVFIQSSMMNKLKVIAAAALGLILCGMVLPDTLQQRFFTLFGDEEALASGEADMHTVGSTNSRKELFFDSLRVTLHNPVFGVGPGLFPAAQDRLARDRGQSMGQWHVTHNTYTQVSSECGIPGLIFFMGAVLGSFRALSRIRRIKEIGPAWDDIRLIANTLRISMWCYCTIAMFASVAYLPFLTILCGLTVGLEYAASQARAMRRAIATPPVVKPKAYRIPELARA